MRTFIIANLIWIAAIGTSGILLLGTIGPAISATIVFLIMLGIEMRMKRNKELRRREAEQNKLLSRFERNDSVQLVDCFNLAEKVVGLKDDGITRYTKRLVEENGPEAMVFELAHSMFADPEMYYSLESAYDEYMRRKRLQEEIEKERAARKAANECPECKLPKEDCWCSETFDYGDYQVIRYGNGDVEYVYANRAVLIDNRVTREQRRVTSWQFSHDWAMEICTIQVKFDKTRDGTYYGTYSFTDRLAAERFFSTLKIAMTEKEVRDLYQTINAYPQRIITR